MGEKLLMEFIGVDMVSTVVRRISGNVNNMAGQVENAATRTGSAWGKVGSLLKVGAFAVLTAVALTGASLGGFIEKTIASGDAAFQLSERFGFAGHEASGWLSVLRQLNVDTDAFSAGLKIMSTHVLANDKLFGALGVRLKDAKGNFRSTNDILMDTIAALNKMPAGVERAGIVSKLFGRGGQSLTPLFDQSPGGIQKMMGGGAEMTDAQVEAAHKLTLEWKQVQEQGLKLATSVGQALLPVLATALGWIMTTGIPGIKMLAQWLGDHLGPIIKGVGGFITKILVPAFQGAGKNLQPLVAQLLPVFKQLMSDIGPIIKGVSDFLGKHHDQIQAVITVISTLIGATVIVALVGAFSMVDLIIKGVTITIGKIVDVIKIAVGWFQQLASVVKGIKMPDLKVPKLSLPSLPHFKAGGFVPSDTMAQLHGGEFVLPADVVSAIRAGNATAMPHALGHATKKSKGGESASAKTDAILQDIDKKMDDLIAAVVNMPSGGNGSSGGGSLSPTDVLAAFQHLVEAAQIQRNRGTRAGYVAATG